MAIAGELVGAADIADNSLPLLLDELRSGRVVATAAPLGALWLPLIDERGLAGCVLARATHAHFAPRSATDRPLCPDSALDACRRCRAIERLLVRLTAMLREAQRS